MATASSAGTEVKDSILAAIGETPLVRLSRLGRELRPALVAKLEALNCRTFPSSRNCRW